jgi:hypothetical protein
MGPRTIFGSGPVLEFPESDGVDGCTDFWPWGGFPTLLGGSKGPRMIFGSGAEGVCRVDGVEGESKRFSGAAEPTTCGLAERVAAKARTTAHAVVRSLLIYSGRLAANAAGMGFQRIPIPRLGCGRKEIKRRTLRSDGGIAPPVRLDRMGRI